MRFTPKYPILCGVALLFFALALPIVQASEPSAFEQSPQYVIESIKIRGNSKTKEYLIRRALEINEGQLMSVDDARFELGRYRVLSLGYFSEVQFKLEKGSARGKAVLVVEVTERGTIVLTDIFLGTSEATKTWGGFGLAENNFLGRGFSVDGAFVLGADPEVERGVLQQSYRLHVAKRHLGKNRLSLEGGFTFLDGCDFFRRSGPASSSDPADFLSIRYRRVGGIVGIGSAISRYTRIYIDHRGEAVSSDVPVGAVRKFPDGGGKPINFGMVESNSVLSLLVLSLERDTRNDPVLPRQGSYLLVSGDFSNSLGISSYDYFKLRARYNLFFPLRWHHVLSFQLHGGVIFGEAPFFEKFFIGDINDLVPGRALGLNFSTLPSRNIFKTSINEKRYEDISFRSSVEYIIPWFRGGKFAYGGDFFFNLGVLALASHNDLKMRDQSFWRVFPVDLTMDAGLRLDTQIGIFRISIGNALGRIPF